MSLAVKPPTQGTHHATEEDTAREDRTHRGRLALAALILGSGYGSLNAQAKPTLAGGPLYLVDMQLDVDGKASARQYRVRLDEPFVPNDESRAQRWEGNFVLRRGEGPQVSVVSTFKFDGETGTGTHTAVDVLGRPFKLHRYVEGARDGHINVSLIVTQAAP